MVEQLARYARIYARDQVSGRQHVERAQCGVAQVADRGCDNMKPGRQHGRLDRLAAQQIAPGGGRTVAGSGGLIARLHLDTVRRFRSVVPALGDLRRGGRIAAAEVTARQQLDAKSLEIIWADSIEVRKALLDAPGGVYENRFAPGVPA